MVVIHPCIQYNKSVAVLLSTVCFQLLCDEIHVPFNSVQYTGSSAGLLVVNNPSMPSAAGQLELDLSAQLHGFAPPVL